MLCVYCLAALGVAAICFANRKTTTAFKTNLYLIQLIFDEFGARIVVIFCPANPHQIFEGFLDEEL